VSAIAAYGLRVELPRTWEGRVYRRVGPLRHSGHPEAYGHPDASVNPVLHLANFALPPARGDFGTGAVERMGPAHVFICLLEYDREEAGRPLFASVGVPRPQLGDFAASALQRLVPGQLGCQRFFTEHGRPLCLYVVLGSRRHAAELVAEADAVLAGLEIQEVEVA
jgi:hypothetical protein